MTEPVALSPEEWNAQNERKLERVCETFIDLHGPGRMEVMSLTNAESEQELLVRIKIQFNKYINRLITYERP